MASKKTATGSGWVAVCDFNTGGYRYKAGDTVDARVVAHLNNFPDEIRDSHISQSANTNQTPAD